MVDFQRQQADEMLSTFETSLTNGVFAAYVQPALTGLETAASLPPGSTSADLNTEDAVVAINNPRAPSSNNNGLSAGQIAGATIGAVAGVALIAAVVTLSMKKKKRGVVDGDTGAAAAAAPEHGTGSGV